MKIRKFNESALDEFYDEVKDAFSFISDDYNAEILKLSNEISFSVVVGGDSIDIFESIEYYEKYLNMLKDISDCLKRLSIKGDLYYFNIGIETMSEDVADNKYIIHLSREVKTHYKHMSYKNS